MICLEELKCQWAPLKINYLFYNNDDAKKFTFIPGDIKGVYDCPEYPKPSDMEFLTKNLNKELE